MAIQLPLPLAPRLNPITAEQTAARLGAEVWQDAQDAEFPYLPLDRLCDGCMYTCRLRWRFAGLTGRSGHVYATGPNCPVLWRFSPYNPLAKVCHIDAARIVKQGQA